MLLEFSVENFRCYRERMTFDFSQNNISAVFGSNSSGKTNMLQALSRTIRMIKEQSSIGKVPPLYQPNDKSKPVSVRMKFSDKDNNIFLYELSVNETSIVKERYTALRFKNDVRNKTNWQVFLKMPQRLDTEDLFIDDEYSYNDMLINRVILDNNTFASFLFTSKIGLREAVFSLYTFTEQIFIIINHDLSDFKEDDLLTHIREDNGNKRAILRLAKLADPTITDLSIEGESRIVCSHGDEKRYFSEESSGTKKTIHMTSIFIHATKTPSIILIDEIDTHFHPLVLSLWLEEINNTDNQIIFIGHNPLVVDFLIGWKVLKDISGIIYLYKDGQGIIKMKKGSELYIDEEDKDKRFSELIYHNWMSYFVEDLVY